MIESDGKEINFGSFLEADVKGYLASSIDAYYNAPEAGPADFIPRS